MWYAHTGVYNTVWRIKKTIENPERLSNSQCFNKSIEHKYISHYINNIIYGWRCNKNFPQSIKINLDSSKKV